MLIELLSTSNYVQFNIKIAQVLGLNTAIYIGQLIEINDKALRKKKVNDDYFTIDRKYIKTRTTIDEATQRDIDQVLIRLSIIKKHPEKYNTISLDISVLTSIMMTPDEDLIKDITEIVAQTEKKVKKLTKEERALHDLQQNIITNNTELRQAYIDWITAVYQKDGFMTRQAVISAQNNLDKFANHDLDVALKVLEVATINAYRDVTWAINNYKKDLSLNGNNSSTQLKPIVVQTPVKRASRMSDEVF